MPLTLSPGDWKAFGEGSKSVIRAVIGSGEDQRTQFLAEVSTTGMTRDDAKVMAASKDLYLAATELFAAIEMFGCDSAEFSTAREKLQAAILKAEARA